MQDRSAYDMYTSIKLNVNPLVLLKGSRVGEDGLSSSLGEAQGRAKALPTSALADLLEAAVTPGASNPAAVSVLKFVYQLQQIPGIQEYIQPGSINLDKYRGIERTKGYLEEVAERAECQLTPVKPEVFVQGTPSAEDKLADLMEARALATPESANKFMKIVITQLKIFENALDYEVSNAGAKAKKSDLKKLQAMKDFFAGNPAVVSEALNEAAAKDMKEIEEGTLKMASRIRSTHNKSPSSTPQQLDMHNPLDNLLATDQIGKTKILDLSNQAWKLILEDKKIWPELKDALKPILPPEVKYERLDRNRQALLYTLNTALESIKDHPKTGLVFKELPKPIIFLQKQLQENVQDFIKNECSAAAFAKLLDQMVSQFQVAISGLILFKQEPPVKLKNGLTKLTQLQDLLSPKVGASDAKTAALNATSAVDSSATASAGSAPPNPVNPAGQGQKTAIAADSKDMKSGGAPSTTAKAIKHSPHHRIGAIAIADTKHTHHKHSAPAAAAPADDDTPPPPPPPDEEESHSHGHAAPKSRGP